MKPDIQFRLLKTDEIIKGKLIKWTYPKEKNERKIIIQTEDDSIREFFTNSIWWIVFLRDS
tara:strand:+ start:3144 stop:3326 length:183 start_codon:yes stop_codon:yes gene_type:complete